MFEKGNSYQRWFFIFFLSIFVTFFCFRPINSPWYRIITADALGYYSYLPAKFIYNDENLDFKWFNKVYNKEYSYNSFAVPDENFMTQYNDRRINKYYPGLSFLWIPFFILAHLICKVFYLNANGFSFPYQLSMGLAALVYACLGLYYLRKLLLKLYQNELIALIVPVAVYYGTNLFTFTIYSGTFTHVYSFTFITMAYYYAYKYFNENDNKFIHALWLALCFLIIVFIRPFNLLFLIAIPFFINDFRRKGISFKPVVFTKKGSALITLIVVLIIYQFSLLYNQTHSLFANTYSNEKFHFERPSHIVDVLFSYYAGWFVYVPLAFFACLSILLLPKNKKLSFVFILLSLVIYLYSNWWFYIILTRTIVDYTSLVAILLGFGMLYLKTKTKLFKPAILLVILCIGYFQLKAYQLRNNILDNNYTYSDYYWRNFFTLRPVSIFPVHPKTVINSHSNTQDFEDPNHAYNVTETVYEGKRAHKLGIANPFSPAYIAKMPDFYNQKGIRKIKTSFWLYVTGKIKNLQLVYRFYSNKDKEIQYLPFYIDKSRFKKNKWTYMEYGCDVLPEIKATDSISVYFWNNMRLNKVYIDKVKTEFFLTDSSMEMIQ